MSTATRMRGRDAVWVMRCLAGLVVFQVLIACLLFANRERTIDEFAGHGFAPTRDAAEGAVYGALLVHLLLAVLGGLFAVIVGRAERTTRVLVAIYLAATAVGGVAAMRLPAQTYLSPIGVLLALGALWFLWRSSRTE
ncbi:hypothetical protein AB0E69_32620 [Kribbella sp. NPDC026611]|uniref:hypothetical protein n=1 Tax=Kribbella sp. NPDC026611 TaxID=3154911 RepID=UPI0033FAB971